MKRLSGGLLEPNLKQSPREGELFRQTAHAERAGQVVVDDVDSLLHVGIINGKRVGAAARHHAQSGDEDVAYTSSLTAEYSFYNPRSLKAAMFDVEVDRRQGGKAELVAKVIVVHPHHRHILRHLDARLIAGHEHRRRLTVVAAHHSRMFRQSSKPMYEPHVVGSPGLVGQLFVHPAEPASLLFLQPLLEAFAAFLRPYGVGIAAKSEVFESPLQEILSHKTACGPIVAREVGDALQQAVVVLGHDHESLFGVSPYILTCREFAKNGVGPPLSPPLQHSVDAPLLLKRERHAAHHPLLPALSRIAKDATQEPMGEGLCEIGQHNKSDHIPFCSRFILHTSLSITQKGQQILPHGCQFNYQ